MKGLSVVVLCLFLHNVNAFYFKNSFSPFGVGLSLAKKSADSGSVASPVANTKHVRAVVEKPKVNDARREALSGVLHEIERSYGKGSILKLGEKSSMTIETTSSGSMTLDLALGGGYPKGRVVEIYGPESSGKTTLALHALAEVQKNGGTAAFIDAEHALDPVYARNLGVNIDELFICQPDSGEMALDVVDHLVRSSAIDMIIVDSVAALVPRAELEGEMTDQQMGLQARLMSKALRKITGSLSRSQSTVIFINQLRSKIGVMYGNPETTAGGNALKFYSSVRLDIRRKEIFKDNTGVMAKVKVVKNKIAPPFRQVELNILFGSGIDKLSCLVDAAESCGVIERKGSWYSKGELKLAQGQKATVDMLKNDDQLRATIESEVRKVINDDKLSGAASSLLKGNELEADSEEGVVL